MSNLPNYLAPSSTMELFVIAVKTRMRESNVTQDELAQRIGVKQPVVARSLSRKGGNLSFETADRIAQALGTTTVDLLLTANTTHAS